MNQKITLLTGPVRSGKTTMLKNWVLNRDGIGGFLTPDGTEGRELYEIARRQIHPFESSAENDEEKISVGRFRFLKSAFNFGHTVAMRDMQDEITNCVIVDEIGKLELSGLGFHPLVLDLLNQRAGKELVFVVRESILDQVLKKYDLGHAAIRTLDEWI